MSARRSVAGRRVVPALPAGRVVLLHVAHTADHGRKREVRRVTWVKLSDTAANHPVVSAPLTWPAEHLDGLDPYDLVEILFGLALRCATRAAQYERDYEVADNIVAELAGPNWRTRAFQVARAGYWTRNATEDGWTLLDDAEHLFHIRKKSELDWERARKRDISNPRLIIAVRLRDGDGCRYCGAIVQWNARRGSRAGTYDHLRPGQPAHTPEDLVVACAGCNGRRGADLDPGAWPLRPAPAGPHYGDLTVRLLAEHGHTVPAAPDASAAGPGDAALRAPRRRSAAPTDEGDAPRVTANLQVGSADSAGRGYSADRNPGRDGVAGRSGTARRGRRGGRRARRREHTEGR